MGSVFILLGHRVRAFRPALFGLLLSLMALPACQNSYELSGDNPREELTAYGQDHHEHRFKISTPEGPIVVEFFEDTPLHRANLVRLIKLGFYDGGEARFHRVIPDFMIQAGNPGRSEPGYLVPAEITKRHRHVRGAVAMARRSDNPGKASNPADFYIVTGSLQDPQTLAEYRISPDESAYGTYLREGGYPSLDGEYTVIGRVTEGMDVVERLSRAQISETAPLQPQRITITLLP